MDLDKMKTLALAAEEVGDIFVMMDKLHAFQCESTPAAVLELIAEVERLRADAARYRYLRNPKNHESASFVAVYSGEPLDSIIDRSIAALTKAGKEIEL